jgi:hypothetical protein
MDCNGHRVPTCGGAVREPTTSSDSILQRVALHVAIAVCLDLPTFSAVMIAALLLYAPPADDRRPLTGSTSLLFRMRPAGSTPFQGAEVVGSQTPPAWQRVS